jgi:hypothetical protein
MQHLCDFREQSYIAKVAIKGNNIQHSCSVSQLFTNSVHTASEKWCVVSSNSVTMEKLLVKAAGISHVQPLPKIYMLQKIRSPCLLGMLFTDAIKCQDCIAEVMCD